MRTLLTIAKDIDRFVLMNSYNVELLNKYTQKLVGFYNSKDWELYTNTSVPENEYHKEIVCENKLYSIQVISWGKNAETPVHCHPIFGCHSKILKGNFIEEFYHPKNGIYMKERFRTEGDISFIHNRYYHHKVNNVSSGEYGCSLQIYFPGYYNNNDFNK